MNIIEYSKKAHEAAKAKGWWDEVKPVEVYLMLIISELAECMEADRKGKRANVEYFKSRMAEIEASVNTSETGSYQTHEQYMNQVFAAKFRDCIKDTVEDELADTAIRVLDLIGHVCNNESDTEAAYKHVDYRFYMDKGINGLSIKSNGSLAADLYDVVRTVNGGELYKLAYNLKRTFLLAKWQNINLVWHIDQKMKYNETRSHKHGGKAY